MFHGFMIIYGSFFEQGILILFLYVGVSIARRFWDIILMENSSFEVCFCVFQNIYCFFFSSESMFFCLQRIRRNVQMEN